MYDYVISLREGIMDAWGGIIGAMKMSNKSMSIAFLHHLTQSLTLTPAQALQPYVQSIFQLLNIISQDMNRSEALMRSAMGVIGYVFPTPNLSLQCA
jgi:importin subunit beta-1